MILITQRTSMFCMFCVLIIFSANCSFHSLPIHMCAFHSNHSYLDEGIISCSVYMPYEEHMQIVELIFCSILKKTSLKGEMGALQYELLYQNSLIWLRIAQNIPKWTMFFLKRDRQRLRVREREWGRGKKREDLVYLIINTIMWSLTEFKFVLCDFIIYHILNMNAILVT